MSLLGKEYLNGSLLKPRLLLDEDQLALRKDIVLGSIDDIEYFDRNNNDNIKWEDLTGVLQIHNDPRQRHRFDRVEEKPEDFFNDVIMDEKVTVYFARDPETREPASTLSITLVRGNQLETWIENGATDVAHHGGRLFPQLLQGAIYKTISQKEFGSKFNENLHAATIIDGDHPPLIKTLLKYGFVPIMRLHGQMGSPTDAERITQVIARKQQGLETRYDSVRFMLPASAFLVGCLDGKYEFLERTGKSDELLEQAREDGVYFASLRTENNELIRQIDISDRIRDILNPIGL